MAFKKYTSGVASIVHHDLFFESDEHQLKFRFFIEDTDAILYCTTHLSPESNLFKRFWKALKYLFGHKSKYGEFDKILLTKEKVKELKAVLESFNKIYP